MDIRRAAPDEAAAITLLVNRAFLPEGAYVEGDRTSLEKITSLMDEGEFYVTEAAGKITGCILIKTNNGTRGYFGMLSVDPDVQGAGIGRRLIEFAEGYCRRAGCGWMDITVLNLREELPPFYRKLGYAESGTKPFTDPHRAKFPCHFLVFSKPLIQS